MSSPQQLALSLLTLMRVISNFLDVLGVVGVGYVIALAFGSDASVPLLQTFFSDREDLLTALLVLVGVLFVAKTALGVFFSRMTALYLAKLESDFASAAAASILGGNLDRLALHSRAEIEWAILRSTNIAFSSLLGQAISFVAELASVVFIFSALVVADTALGLIVSAYFSVIFIVFHYFSRKVAAVSGSDFASESVSVNQTLTDVISAFREISVSGRMGGFLERLFDARQAVAVSQATMTYLGAIPRYVAELGLILGAISLALIQLVRDPSPEGLSILGIFLVGSVRMISALLPVQRSFLSVKFETPGALAAQELIRDLRSRKSRVGAELVREDLAKNLNRAVDVNIDGLVYRYLDETSEKKALKDISLRIQAGSTVAFVGPSGAGKSTLADLVLGLRTPEAGTVECNGVSPRSLSSVRRGILGYVPQRPGIVSGSISGNVAIGVNHDEIDAEKVWRALEATGLAETVKRLPGQLESNLGNHSDALSGGQLQRLGLARALYTDPMLLVLDESTSALDAETEADITTELSRFRGQVTTIVIAHRLSTIQRVDRIFVFDKGQLVAEGTFPELRKSNELIKRYVKLMSFD